MRMLYYRFIVWKTGRSLRKMGLLERDGRTLTPLGREAVELAELTRPVDRNDFR